MPDLARPDASHIPDFLEDRGPTEYFHGRTKVLNNFEKLLKRTMQTDRGTTFLIQGAPGAGKTALLEEIALDALDNRWDIVEINLGDLYNPARMAQTLGKPYIARKKTATKVDSKLLSREHIKEVAGESSVSQVLEKMNPKQGMLLIFDEAQRVSDFKDTPDKKIQVAETLDEIHNGKLSNPVILLAAGLGPTEEAFRLHGISRFKAGCFVELGALGKESECAVIRDWLVKEGGVKGNPDPWIDAIAKKTHGWPQHISAYGDAAAKQIQNDHGEMTPAGLEIVYKLGKDRREAYYEQRAEGITRKERSSLARLIKDDATEDGLDKEDIEEFLSLDFGPEKAEYLFNRALEKGILHRQKGVYTIPIPSMRTWLISNYARVRKEFLHTPQLNPPPFHERDSRIGPREL